MVISFLAFSSLHYDMQAYISKMQFHHSKNDI
jgi:hypothetical protein